MHYVTHIQHIKSESDFDKSILNARSDRGINEGPSIILDTTFSDRAKTSLWRTA